MSSLTETRDFCKFGISIYNDGCQWLWAIPDAASNAPDASQLSLLVCNIGKVEVDASISLLLS